MAVDITWRGYHFGWVSHPIWWPASGSRYHLATGVFIILDGSHGVKDQYMSLTRFSLKDGS